MACRIVATLSYHCSKIMEESIEINCSKLALGSWEGTGSIKRWFRGMCASLTCIWDYGAAFENLCQNWFVSIPRTLKKIVSNLCDSASSVTIANSLRVEWWKHSLVMICQNSTSTLDYQQHSSFAHSPSFPPSLRPTHVTFLLLNTTVILSILRLLSTRAGSFNYSKILFTLVAPAMISQRSSRYSL